MPGANGTMTADDLKPFVPLIKSADYLLMQLEIPLEVVEFAAATAYENGTKIIINPAPARYLPDSLLAMTYILTPNEKECMLLCGKDVSDDVRANAEYLLNKGVRNVIVTLGEGGSLLCNAEKQMSVPAVKVDATDTVAAGDTYSGALCTALSEGMTMAEAMVFATKASAISVTRSGAQPSVPYRNEIH